VLFVIGWFASGGGPLALLDAQLGRELRIVAAHLRDEPLGVLAAHE